MQRPTEAARTATPKARSPCGKHQSNSKKPSVAPSSASPGPLPSASSPPASPTSSSPPASARPPSSASATANTSSPPTPPSSPVALPSYQAGVNLLFYANSGYPTGLSKMLTELRHDGVNSIAITFPFYQASLTADSVASGTGTPPDTQLEGLINTLEGDGFSVMLRPLLNETDLAPQWRGAIEPRSPTAWFASYTTLISHYPQLATTTHVHALHIGTERSTLA